jgi:hypothetical protein
VAQLENITSPYALYFQLAAQPPQKAKLKHLHFGAALLNKGKKRQNVYATLLTQLFSSFLNIVCKLICDKY